MSKKIRVKARALPDSHEWGFASTGTEQVGMRVTILEGEYQGEVTWYGYFTEATEQRTLESLSVAGWDGTDIINLPGLGSTEFELQLEEETDDKGNKYLRPTFINRIGVAMKHVMDAGAKAAFAARMRGASMQFQKGAAPAARPSRQAPAPARSRDGNGGTRLPAQYAEDAPMPADDDIGF